MRGHFSGHETFPFRYTWLKKAVDGVLDNGSVFSEDGASVRFGVGKNMVSSMRHWSVSLGLLEDASSAGKGRLRPLRATELGSGF